MAARRILHVVGAMNPGGVESWLMNVLRRIDRRQFQIDFLVHTPESAEFDQEIRDLGSRIYPCVEPRHPTSYRTSFRRIMATGGPYDVIHSHVHHYSGFILRLAANAGVPGRIAHSHSNPSYVRLGLTRRLYLALMKRWIQRYATVGLACSNQAACSLFGNNWQQDSRWRVLYCGIDVEPFATAPDRTAVRSELGIPPDALVLGHVGRFDDAKNHSYLVDVAWAIKQQQPRCILLLVGDGPLRSKIESKVDSLGMAKNVVFGGRRTDVPRLMLGAMDLFLFPSRHEGLGLSLVEAQAAGLPCLVSQAVPDEAAIVKPLIHRMSTDETPREWAAAALDLYSRRPEFAGEYLKEIIASPFNIDASVHRLEQLYSTRFVTGNGV